MTNNFSPKPFIRNEIFSENSSQKVIENEFSEGHVMGKLTFHEEYFSRGSYAK